MESIQSEEEDLKNALKKALQHNKSFYNLQAQLRAQIMNLMNAKASLVFSQNA